MYGAIGSGRFKFLSMHLWLSNLSVLLASNLDENELCPADFTPLTQEQISALKAEKRQRDQQRKQKLTENRKHLANVRVVQKNLEFVFALHYVQTVTALL
jgi:hypothetical protein